VNNYTHTYRFIENNNKLDDLLMHSDDDHNMVPAPTTPPTLTGIHAHGDMFHDNMVEKYLDKEGQQCWKCKWCSTEYAGWNTTKVIRHLNKIAGKAFSV
jgi:hypothetical protein